MFVSALFIVAKKRGGREGKEREEKKKLKLRSHIQFTGRQPLKTMPSKKI